MPPAMARLLHHGSATTCSLLTGHFRHFSQEKTVG